MWKLRVYLRLDWNWPLLPGWSEEKLEFLYNYSFALNEAGQLDPAIFHLKNALTLPINLGAESWKIRCWNLLGILQRKEGHFESAKNCYNLILQHERASESARAKAFHYIGNIYKAQDDLVFSEYYLLKALAVKRRLNDRKLLYSTIT